jgi:hypothetical protein
MRCHKVLMALVILSACGGGSDVTSPPGTFSLSVSGEGPGGGHVTTTPGLQPAIDCTLAPGAQPSGACSGNYAAGNVVDLILEPAEGSALTGWSGDATSCSTQLTCSLPMDQNRTAVAQLTTASTSVQITKSAFHPDPTFSDEGAVIWVVEVKNVSALTVESARVDFTSHDAAGAVLASDFTFVGPIPPGETRAGKSFAGYTGTEASVDFNVGEVVFATEDLHLGAAQVTSSNWHVDPTFGGTGAVIWTVEVQNTSASELESVEVDFITYDANGQIVNVDFTFVGGPIPPGEKRSSESFADVYGTEANAQFQIASVTLPETAASLAAAGKSGARPSWHEAARLWKRTR